MSEPLEGRPETDLDRHDSFNFLSNPGIIRPVSDFLVKMCKTVIIPDEHKVQCRIFPPR